MTKNQAMANASTFSLTLARNVAMSFQWIKPGEFWMGARGEWGDEEPIHRVRITRGFYLGTFPVTQAQFAAWTKSAKVEHKNEFDGRPDHPAENMDWNQATKYCEWLNERHGERLPAGYFATLPTEAQWEYACRAGTDTEYHSGDGAAALDDAGWFDEAWDSGSTHPVGQKLANDWGLHDMHGNVWEWCQDAWDADAYKWRPDGVTDPVVMPEDVQEENPDRVVRGGSWDYRAGFCRSAIRFWFGADYRDWNRGFRVCLVSGPVAVPARKKKNKEKVRAEPDRQDGG